MQNHRWSHAVQRLQAAQIQKINSKTSISKPCCEGKRKLLIGKVKAETCFYMITLLRFSIFSHSPWLPTICEHLKAGECEFSTLSIDFFTFIFLSNFNRMLESSNLFILSVKSNIFLFLG